MSIDDVLIATYGEIQIPADQILLNEPLGDQFFEQVRRKTTEPIERRATLSRLLTLRKMGRLPRLRRSK